ncbi:MAG: ribosome small subunit-dependent GTPase A [Prevotellaceae bacterium]|jgi:ribosome biogenesis GTPase|nr:ribosome small subunit-dependent GTPase A [Prevotellaceae bacterium]
MFTGIVYKHTGSHYLVKHPESGVLYDCTARGKLRLHDNATTNPIAAGDQVDVAPVTETGGVIIKIHPRKNYIIRRAANLSKQAHIIAANLDVAFLIVTIDFPVVQMEFIDRFLVTCEAYKVPVKIAVNKMDLYGEAQLEALQRFQEIYAGAGYELLCVSAQAGWQIETLREAVKGKLCLFSGQSGVGKSSLINAIDAGLQLRTGPLSDYHRKGIHTTTFYEIFDTAAGGQVIDSPGIKGFGLIDVEKEELYHFFPELFRCAAQCKYNMCTHTHEPDCAVKTAVDRGDISPERYESYLKMLEDKGGKYR